MHSDRPRRMAELLAGAPYRAFHVNVPLDYCWSVEGFRFNGRDYNVGLAEGLLKEQAPIIYSDDVINTLPSKNPIELWAALRKMQLVPRAMLPYDRLFIECSVPDIFKVDPRQAAKEAAEDGYDPKKYGVCVNIGAGVQYADFAPKIMRGIKERCINEMLLGTIRFEGMSEKKIVVEMITKPVVDRQTISLNAKLMQTHVPVYLKKFKDELGLADDAAYETYLEQCKLVMITPFYQRDRQDKLMGPFGIGFYLIGPDYKIVRMGEGVSVWLLTMAESDHFQVPMSDEATTQLYGNFYRIASIAIQTISLLNCSNVRLVPTGKTNEDIGRRRRDQMRLAVIRHHELRVKVGEQFLRVDGRNETGISICPLHPVRGHFRDYSTGLGLFGKYKYDCVWIPPFVRGDAADGIVVRDYVLEPGQENAK